MSSNDVDLFYLAQTRLWLLVSSCVISPICSESLQSFVSVLSRVDEGGEVDAPPTAAVASTTSGIDPVSNDPIVDYYVLAPLLWTHKKKPLTPPGVMV